MQTSTAAEPAHVVDGVDVDAVVVAVTACPSVSGMAAGMLAGATTLLPGRRVTGVRVTADEVLVEVRSRWAAPVARLAGEIRAATAPLLAGHRLHLLVADIDDPPGAPPPGSEPIAVAPGPDVLDRPTPTQKELSR